MQYLVSVIDDESGSGTEAEMAAIDVFNQRLQDEGTGSSPTAWAGRDSHCRRRAGERAGFHRRALRGVEGVPRRLLDHRGARPRRGTEVAAEGSKACNRKVEVRPFQ